MLADDSPKSVEKIASPKIIRNLSVGSNSSSGGSSKSGRSRKATLKLGRFASDN